MHPLKRLLQAHRPVFVAGMLGMERYDWFRNLLDPVFRNLIPARETDMETDTLLFFFPSRQNIAWAELETGGIISLPLNGEIPSRIIANYFPVSHNLMPNGFIFIVLPSFGKSFDLNLSFMERFQGKLWLKPDSRLLWVDCFPFAQKNALETLAEFHRNLTPLDTTVGLLRSGRRYGYSDLSGEDTAIEQAKEGWASLELCNETVVIESEANRNLFKSLLYKRRSYYSPIQSHIKHDVKAKYMLFRKYFHEDYHWMVSKEVTADFVDPVFLYEEWVKESSGLIAGWNIQVRRRLLPKLNEEIAIFVRSKLDETEVYDLDTLLKTKLDKVWKKGFKHISDSLEEGDLLSDSLTEIQYMAAIKTYKAQFIEAFTHVMQVILCNAVEEIIEKHYDLWNRLA
ncbi:hypothetical protein [Paenibacillus sp. FSL R7-0337]|uniref:hypothetical protein n=1 Tax=Paenibacillus sp. FSL R7-0337 TaxID=1926588 RepID=UPI00096DD00E|nr:hypothetical protein [Paenibacillus sp. FSL R7-0337]OMF98810.1 hypothetical protein BK147_08200 [Paenibacillus sp. FSL R7-0337]